MTSGNLSLSEAYRPRCFDDFIGKSQLVGYLKRQLADETARSVLLHGPAGCGKSSLAEVYAAGLLCEKSDNRPCRQCRSCLDVRDGRHLNLRIFEYGRVNDEEFADQVNSDVRVETMGNGRFVILINRADLLSSKAFELLHDQMKRSYVRVTFILCTHDFSAIPEKTAASFFPLKVEQPSFSDARTYLHLLRDNGRIDIDETSIEALADLSRSSYQRLALDLEILSQKSPVILRDVVEYFVTDHAVRYVDQVIDRQAFSEQLGTLEAWNVPPGNKIDGIGRYLSDLFDLQCGLRPGSLRWSKRLADLSGTIAELSKAAGITPRAFVKQMIQIWDPEIATGPTTLRRKASEFDDLFAIATLDISHPAESATSLHQAGRRTREFAEADALAKRQDPEGPLRDADEDTSLTLSEARRLWDGASFLVQGYGVFLNAAISIRHARLDGARRLPEHVATDFLHQFRMYVARWKREPKTDLHSLYAHQTDEEGRLVTRIIAHIPDCARDPKNWVINFAKRHAAEVSINDFIDARDALEKDRFRRHLEFIQGLCAGLRAVSPEDKIFLRRARIDAKRSGWSAGEKVTAQRVGLSRLIDHAQQLMASEDLDVLYAFEHSAMDPCSGWERAQYLYRRKVVEQREWLEATARDHANARLALSKVKAEWKRAKDFREAARPFS